MTNVSGGGDTTTRRTRRYVRAGRLRKASVTVALSIGFSFSSPVLLSTVRDVRHDLSPLSAVRPVD